jgi:carboxyl-terminal processing protease
MAAGLGGMLTDKEFSFGIMRLRSGRVAFTAYPQAGAYTGPLAVIIDSGSASTSEIFAAGLQETGRAIIVGEQSPGAALPSTFVKLPTGALFQYAIADFQTPQGVLIEGRGVRPDIGVRVTRAGLSQGVDAPLAAASEYLQKQGKQKQEKKLP